MLFIDESSLVYTFTCVRAQMTYLRAQAALGNRTIQYFYGREPMRGHNGVDRNCDEHGPDEMMANKFYLRMFDKRQLIIDSVTIACDW